MSLGFDNEYNKKLRKKLMDFDNPIQANRSQPDMFYRQAQSDFILPYSKPSYPTLALALKAERQIGNAQGQYDGMEGEGLGDVFKSASKSVSKGVKSASKSVSKGVKSATKSVSKGVKSATKEVKSAAKSVAKEADKFAKSPVGKELGRVGKSVGTELGRVGKSVGTFTLDLAEKNAAPLGAAIGLAAAAALEQPELAPAFAAIGAHAGKELGHSARKGIKSVTGLGLKDLDKKPANKWILHVKRYAKEHNLPYKMAMKEAKSSYTK